MPNCCVCDVSCQVLPSHQLIQEISELAEIIYNLGISSYQSRILLTFLPDTSAHQMFNFFVGWRSNISKVFGFTKGNTDSPPNVTGVILGTYVAEATQ
jgi:hypothetical protein